MSSLANGAGSSLTRRNRIGSHPAERLTRTRAAQITHIRLCHQNTHTRTHHSCLTRKWWSDVHDAHSGMVPDHCEADKWYGYQTTSQTSTSNLKLQFAVCNASHSLQFAKSCLHGAFAPSPPTAACTRPGQAGLLAGFFNFKGSVFGARVDLLIAIL